MYELFHYVSNCLHVFCCFVDLLLMNYCGQQQANREELEKVKKLAASLQDQEKSYVALLAQYLVS